MLADTSQRHHPSEFCLDPDKRSNVFGLSDDLVVNSAVIELSLFTDAIPADNENNTALTDYLVSAAV